MSNNQSYKSMLETLYPGTLGSEAADKLKDLLQSHGKALQEAKRSYVGDREASPTGLPLDENDAFIITYGDTFLLGTPPSDPKARKAAELGIGGGIDDEGNLNPLAPENLRHLRALEQFAGKYLKDVVSGIHILPFFPYSSDDGFSIVDYYEVNPDIGDWEDIRNISKNFRLMSDLVLNHCSAKGPWFRSYLAGSEEYRDYFIDLPADTDVSQVVRPRTHHLLSAFSGIDPDTGKPLERNIWTTFSRDQVDLNFGHPDVLLQMIDAILFFVENGAQVIRLDAIAYLWKELGTPCIHHENTHLAVKLYRKILDELAPWVVLITETNVPHEENMSYFGKGTDEAHMIYQFSLPPLIFDAFLRGNASYLTEWARHIPAGAPGPIGYASTYFNFCASHDGVGVTPTHGILSDEERNQLVQAVTERGGRVNYKATPQGKIPYELNINYFSAIADRDLPQDMRIRKFLASQAILLSVAGVPGIYIHSLIGSQNWEEGVELTGANRTINRQKLFLSEVEKELNDPTSLRYGVFNGYTHMLKTRKEQPAFHPASRQVILDAGTTEIFAVRREAESGQVILCLINTAGAPARAKLHKGLGNPVDSSGEHAPEFFDLLTREVFCSSLQCFDEDEKAIPGDEPAARTTGAARGENSPASKDNLSEQTAILRMAPWEVLWLEIRNGKSGS